MKEPYRKPQKLYPIPNKGADIEFVVSGYNLNSERRALLKRMCEAFQQDLNGALDGQELEYHEHVRIELSLIDEIWGDIHERI